MFILNQLRYIGRKGNTDVFSYNGIRIEVIVAREDDGNYCYVGLSNDVPKELAQGMLSWFGIDRYQHYAKYRFQDNSCYYVQKKSA